MATNELRFKATMDDKVAGPMAQIEKKFASFGTTYAKHFGGGSEFAKGIGLAAGVAGFGLLGAAASGAASFIGDSIGAASSLNESLGKSNVVFGKSAKEVEAWAQTASTAFGESEQQALEAAGTFGNLFQAFGVGKDKSVQMSESLVQLAADLASFNNTSVDDAITALRSGLSGETEPLKRYGIAISDARMRTELASQGFKNLGSTLTPLQKSTASYALIMKDSTLAQGDFARTSDGLANSQRTLQAKIGDLSAKLGGALIPIAKAAVGALGGLVDIVSQVGYAFDRTTIPLEKLEAAAANGTGGAIAQFNHLQEAAQQMGMSVEDTYKLMGEASSTNVDDLRRWQANVADLLDRSERSYNDAGDATTDMANTTGAELTRMSADYATFAGKALISLDKVYLKEKHHADELNALARSAISGYFDPIILHDRLMADEAELSAARRVLASGKATKAEKADALATVHALEKATTESRIELFESGQLNKKEQAKLLKDLREDWKHSTGAAKAYLASLIAAILAKQNVNVNVTVSGGQGTGGSHAFASGGHYEKGEPRIVGEEGIELDVPDHSGTILNHADTVAMMSRRSTGGSAGWGGGTPMVIHTHVYLDKRQIAEAVDEYNYRALRRAAPTGGRV